MSIYTNIKRFSNSFCASVLLLSNVFICQAVQAKECCGTSERSTQKLAKHLVDKFWNDVKRQDVHAYSHLLAARFQGLNTSGHYNKEDQISGLEGLTVTSFKIKNLIASRYGKTLVISYDFLAEGQGIVSGPSTDIWHKKKCQWKLVSHSYVPFL